MAQYPNYLNQPFQQQFNYPQYGYQPMQPDRLSQLQQFQQSLQPQQIPPSNQLATMGKIVDSVDVVKATDVPMDGNMYYFPKADGTEIYGKQFGMDGKTRILTFKPLLEDNPSNSPSEDIKTQFGAFGEVLGAIQSDIRMLFDKVDKISKPAKQKGGADNE